MNDLEDKLFEDCCKIADKYETNLLTVLGVYANVESDHKGQSYESLIASTKLRVKHDFIKRLGDEKKYRGVTDGED